MSRRGSYVVVAVLLQIVAVGACSDPPIKPPPAVQGNAGGGGSGGGGGGGAGGADSGLDASLDDGGVCTDVALNGPLVDRIAVSADPPVATGGTVVDGLYDLTEYTFYAGPAGVGGPTGITARASLRISGGKLDQVIEVGGTGKTMTTTRSSAAYSVTGANLAATELCPTTGGGKQLSFTANDPLLVLTDLSSKEAFTFTKR